MRKPGRSGPGWTRPITERLTPAIQTLVLLQTALFLLYVFVEKAQDLFLWHLALGPGFFRGEVWQPVTSLFVHVGSQATLRWIFNMIGLWFVGALVERTVGTPRFLAVFFAPAVVANLVLVLVARSLGHEAVFDGSSMGVLALFVAFGRLYNRQSMQILGSLFLQARHLAMILVGWAILASLLSGNLPLLVGNLVACTMAFFMGGGPGLNLEGAWERFKLQRLKKRYRVIEGGRRGGKNQPPSYLN